MQQIAARGKKAGGQSVGTNFSQKSFTLRPKSSVRGRQSGSAYTCPMICRQEKGWSGRTTEAMDRGGRDALGDKYAGQQTPKLEGGQPRASPLLTMLMETPLHTECGY